MIFPSVPRPFSGERTVFSTNGVGKTGYPHAKEWSLFLILYHIQKLKQIKDPNVRPQAMKILEENRGKASWHWIWQWFISMTPKVQAVKPKIHKRNFIKLKNFCSSKDTISRVKRWHMEWEKVFANQISDKGLISRTYKKPLQLNNRKTNNLILKRAKDLNRHFSKDDSNGQKA